MAPPHDGSKSDHFKRPILNVLGSTPAGENAGCCVPASGLRGGRRNDTRLPEEEKKCRDGDGNRRNPFKANPS